MTEPIPEDYTGRVREFAANHKRIAALKAEAEVLEERQGVLAPILLLDFEQANRQRDTIDDVTVHLHRDRRPIWLAKDEHEKTDWPRLVAAFREAGLSSFISAEKVNWQSVRGYLAELAQKKEDLPPSLRDLVGQETTPSIRVKGR